MLKIDHLTEDHIRAAFWNTFNTPSGQITLAVLHEIANMTTTTYTPGDSHGTAFNEGRRSLFLDINRYMEDTDEHHSPGQPDHAPFDPGTDDAAPEQPGSDRAGLSRRALDAALSLFRARDASGPGSGGSWS